MRPSSSKVITKPSKIATTGWLDSDDDNDDDDCNNDKQPLINESVLKQQQQYLLKGLNFL